MLRTPAPLIGALGVSLKRALAVLARHACEFQIKVCSRLSLVLEGRGLVCTEFRACGVLALPSGSIRALLGPGPMAALRALPALSGVLLAPDKGQVLVSPASSKPWFRKRCPQGVCVCFAQWLNPSLDRVVSACRAKPAIETLSTRGLPRRTRSLIKLKALIRASP